MDHRGDTIVREYWSLNPTKSLHSERSEEPPGDVARKVAMEALQAFESASHGDPSLMLRMKK